MVEHRAVYIASEALLLAREQDHFRLSDLKARLSSSFEDPPSESLIRVVLRQLEAAEWLEREHPQGRVWHASRHLK